MLKHIKLTISKVNNVYEKYKEEKKGNYPKITCTVTAL